MNTPETTPYLLKEANRNVLEFLAHLLGHVANIHIDVNSRAQHLDLAINQKGTDLATPAPAIPRNHHLGYAEGATPGKSAPRAHERVTLPKQDQQRQERRAALSRANGGNHSLPK